MQIVDYWKNQVTLYSGLSRLRRSSMPKAFRIGQGKKEKAQIQTSTHCANQKCKCRTSKGDYFNYHEEKRAVSATQNKTHLLIEVYGTIKITHPKHYLTQRLRSRLPFQKLKLITIRILNKSDYCTTTFDRSRFPCYFAPLRLYEIYCLGNLCQVDRYPCKLSQRTKKIIQ